MDVDIYNGTSDVGGGAPSSAFSGAGGQPGVWNAYPGDYGGSYDLVNVDGTFTGVSVHGNHDGMAGMLGWNNPDVSGDVALLMKDAEVVGVPLTYNLTGLADGEYRVYTYVCSPDPGYPGSADVFIAQALGEQTRHAEGTLPGNYFIEGRTHTVHDVLITDGSLDIQISGPWPKTFVNGFQLVPVPEPASLASLGLGALLFLRRKRKSPDPNR